MLGRAFFALDLGVNFLAPWLLYRASRPQVDETHAIMISAGAPAIWGLVQFARNRKVDTFSILSLGGIFLSLTILAFGGSPKMLLVRESLIGGIVGSIFLGSALAGRPLAYALMRGILSSAPQDGGMMTRAREEFESFAGEPWFQQVIMQLTIAFGLLGVTEMAARVALAFALPTERFLIVAPVARYGIAGLFIVWMFLFVMPGFRRQKAGG